MIKTPVNSSTSKAPPASRHFKTQPLTASIKALLYSSVSASLIYATGSFAQETTTPEAEQEDSNEFLMEELTVEGIRASQRSAIERKKMAATMADSIVAEDIGEFPDKNVGEALQRVTGVQIDRDFGEGSKISIRGVEPDLVRVEVNGVSALGMSDPDGGTRAVDFRDMASELVKALDVIKGSEARIAEGGVGGTVRVITRKPNDFDNNYLQFNLENQYNDLSDNNDPKANFTGVYKFSEDFGALLNVTASEKKTMIHALRNTEWVALSDWDNSPEKTFSDPDYAGIETAADCPDTDCESQWYDFSPRVPRYGIWERDEERISANVVFDYNFTDNLSGHVSYTYNERDKVANDQNLHLEVPSEARVQADSVTVDADHNVTSFTTAEATVNNRTLNFDWEQKTSIFDAGFDYTNGNWDVTGLVGISRQKQFIDSRDTNVRADRVGGVPVTLNSDGAPSWDFNQGFDWETRDDAVPTSFDVNDPASYWQLSDYLHQPTNDSADEDMVQLDVTYTFDDGLITKLHAGLRATDQTAEALRSRQRITRQVGSLYNGVEWTLEDQIALITGNTTLTDELFDGFDLGVDTIGQYEAISTQGFIDDFLAMVGDNLTESDTDITYPIFYNVGMETQGIYLQADFETEIAGFPVWGNFGARYVRTETETTGDAVVNVIVDALDENGDVIPGSGVDDPDNPLAFVGRRTVSTDYSDFLPSVNVSVGLIPDQLILYAGAAKVMARPKVTDLNLAATCTIYQNTQAIIDETENTCKGGNPNLDPYRADQFDVALSWYPNADSLLSIAYFEKKIDSYILDDIEQFEIDYFGDGDLYDVTQPINGEGVTTTGIEFQASTFFSMLPAPFDRFGGSVNYTHMTADNVGLFNELNGEELPFPSQSENSYNLSVYYEADLFSARLAYNYRDEYLVSPSDRSGNPVFVDDSGYLDAKISFTVPNSNLKVYMDARNLTEQEKLVTAGPHRLSDLQWSGREFALGFTYSM